jgi:hypothetical protein
MSYHLETKNPTDRPTDQLTPIYPLKLRLWWYNYPITSACLKSVFNYLITWFCCN